MAPKKKEDALAVHPDGEGFKERVTPKQPDENLFLFKCRKCEGVHFRHAGYVTLMLPFLRAGGEKRVGCDDVRVMVCVKCKSAWAWITDQMYDLTDKIDLEAWEKTEKEAHKATGPGGQC